MISRKTKYLRLDKALDECREFDNWFAQFDDADNIRAKTALTEFFKEYLKISPDRRLDLGSRQDYYMFYVNLLPVREALEERNYPHACHELLTLFHYEPILQNRVYVCLEKLYHEYLEE